MIRARRRDQPLQNVAFIFDSLYITATINEAYYFGYNVPKS